MSFLDKHSKEKNCSAAEKSEGHCKPSPALWNPFWLFAFYIVKNIALAMVIRLFLGELISIILIVWRSEFGIPSHYTGLKIAPDMTLVSPVITQFGTETLASFYITTCFC